MAQHDYVIANGTGAAVRSDLNGGLAAIVSNNSGATEPATMYAYQWWADTTAGLLKLRNSANNAWITLRQLDGEFTTLPVENGTAAAPSIYFKDSGTDTGIFSPGADQVAISTGGTSRLSIDASGNIAVDTNTLYVDAVNNRVAIGTTSPSSILSLGGNLDFKQASNISTTSGYLNLNPTGSLILDGTPTVEFRINTIEAARIDSSRRLLVGTIASPAHALQVSTDSAGKPSTNTWTIVSDERIKEDIELADLDLCYQAVKSIPLKRFKWKDEVYTEEQVKDRRKLGWIAQDVEAVFPKAVGTYEFKYNQVFEETIIPAVEEELDDDGNITTPAQPERIEKGELISEDVIEDCRDLNSDQLYAAMYGAIQKLMAKVEALEASNTDLLARVSALEIA